VPFSESSIEVRVDTSDPMLLEQALRHSVERFRALVEATSQIVWTTAPDGLITADSPSWRAFTGQTLDEWKGYGWLDALHPDDRQASEDAWRSAVADRRPYEVVYRVQHVGGGYRHTLARGVPVLGPDGEIREWVGMNVDITDRVQAEAALRESRSMLQTVLDNIPLGVFWKNRDGAYLGANREAATSAGFASTAEMVGKTDFDVAGATPEQIEFFRKTDRAVMESGQPRRDILEPITRHDGHTDWLNTHKVPLTNDAGEIIGVLGACENVTERLKAEHALREAEQQFRTLADSIPQLAWMARPDGWIFWYNKRWYDYTGSTPEEMEGWGWRNVHDPSQIDRVLASYRNAFETGEPWEDTFPLRRFDGEMRWHLTRAMPVRDESGTIVRWFGTNTDITDRLRANDELARLKEESDRRRRVYEAALSNTPDLVYIFDLDHRFTYANRALLDILGRPWDEVIGKTCLALGYPQWHAEMHDREIEQVIVTKQPIRGEVPFIGTKGRRIYDYIFCPVLDANGEVVAIAGTTRDVTDRQHSEQAIREQAEQLREADRRKDEFLATLGHELRNPLASIVSASEAMALDRSAANEAEMREIIERQAGHMSRLIDDLLDVARIARGKILLRAERIDLAQVVRETIEDHRRETQDAGLKLAVNIVDGPLWVSGDRTRLSQVVGNLLHNAAKFTDAGGEIRVTVTTEKHQAVLRVRDSGLGMTREMLSRIFVPFNQADASLARSRGGLGLGLALVKGLVELHGGSVSAVSDGLGSGSEFAVRLSLVTSREDAADETDDDDERRPSLRILAIDDRRDILRPMQVLLAREGHDVEIVTDGRSGFETACSLRPDVIICDIGLPGEMNGYDVARALRETPETSAVYLVALTGYGQENDRLAALDAGFDLHLTKPIDIRVLRSVLANVTPAER